MDGKQVSLADYRGQVILINNWATWCPPCIEEMPVLDAYYQKHRKENFIIVGIEAGDSKEVVADFLNKTRITFPIWLDPDEKAYDVFHNPALPSSYVVDRNGTIRLTWTGKIDRITLEKYLTPLLEE
jgi:thiol-disulfide isomerase/thioredoxin